MTNNEKSNTWNPEVAYYAFQRAEKSQTQSERLRISCQKMAGTATVNECVVTVYENKEPRQLSVLEYVDWLASEAKTLHAEFIDCGGAEAMAAYSEQFDKTQID